MKKILYVVLLMIALNIPKAFAYDWQEAGFHQYTKIVNYNFPYVDYLMETVLFEPEYLNGELVTYKVMYTKTNCDERSIAILSYMLYNINGKILLSRQASKAEKDNPDYQELVEGSIGEQAWKSVCDGED